jgi:predicted alpha-1,2-mannosidase
MNMKLIQQIHKYFWLILIFFYSCNNEDVTKYVDPTIGGVGVILEPTRPTVHLPNQMVRVFPIRNDQLDDRIRNFPLSNASHRLYSIFGFMPLEEEITSDSWHKWLTYDNEITTPYYYASELGDSGCFLEFTPSKKSGIFRVSFSKDKNHYLRLCTLNTKGEIRLQGKRQIVGEEEFAGMKAYLYAEISSDATEAKYLNDTNKNTLIIDVGNSEKEVLLRYGLSYISIEQARQNLENEIPDNNFEAVKSSARETWNNALSLIRVKGGTDAQKRVFYTAFYRCYERMVDINEYGKYYSNYDKQVHESDKPFLVDNWIWDNYIALEPLHTIIGPDVARDRINSYIEMYKQGGTMPSFALVTGDWPAMTGNFAAAWIADAWFKGVRDFDLKTAYEGIRKNSLDATLIPWRNGPKTWLDEFYDENGYMPGLRPGEKETVSEVDTAWERRQSVAVTTANSYSDWCIAQLAYELDKPGDNALFLKRAAFYKNVFRTDKNFMWPKDKDGNWIEPYDPRFADRSYFTENNAYTFDWDVKHDFEGLFQLMGGREKAEAKLDQLFREDLGMPKFRFWAILPDASGLVGQFSMGNEPSFHIPYLYNYLGSPWKTQKRVRMLLDAFFTDNLFGIPGDEDGGGMSAFVVFSMMGFFPVTPGIPVYAIGSPVFEEIAITLPGGKEFVIKAKNSSKENKYIQTAKLNGKVLDKSWFTHETLVKGGTLELEMGNHPNKAWGAGENNAPPSSIHYTNKDFK